MQPTLKEIIGADKEGEYFAALDDMAENAFDDQVGLAPRWARAGLALGLCWARARLMLGSLCGSRLPAHRGPTMHALACYARAKRTVPQWQHLALQAACAAWVLGRPVLAALPTPALLMLPHRPPWVPRSAPAPTRATRASPS